MGDIGPVRARYEVLPDPRDAELADLLAAAPERPDGPRPDQPRLDPQPDVPR